MYSYYITVLQGAPNMNNTISTQVLREMVQWKCLKKKIIFKNSVLYNLFLKYYHKCKNKYFSNFLTKFPCELIMWHSFCTCCVLWRVVSLDVVRKKNMWYINLYEDLTRIMVVQFIYWHLTYLIYKNCCFIGYSYLKLKYINEMIQQFQN